MIQLTLEFNGRNLATYNLDKPEMTIGRNAGNDICIDSLAVSDRHARIVVHQGRYWLEDLKSTNGTFLDFARVERSPLKNHQRITVGKHVLTVALTPSKVGTADVIKTMKLDTEAHKNLLNKQR
jgi:pSer/pThr/pTyr-binding forkhead associated (FHA) protein